MKKSHQHLARLAMIIAATGAISAPAFAQPEGPQQGRPGAHGQHKHDGQRMGDRMGHRGQGAGIERMRGLDLSSAQRDKIFEIRHAAAPEQRQAMKDVFEARQALRELSRAEKFDEGKAKAAAEREGAAIAKATLLRAKTENQIHAVLTPEQRQKLQERRAPKPAPADAQPAKKGS